MSNLPQLSNIKYRSVFKSGIVVRSGQPKKLDSKTVVTLKFFIILSFKKKTNKKTK